MKTYLKTVIAVVTLVMALTGCRAQTKLNEGTVVYAISPTDNDMDEQVASILPKEMTVIFKGDNGKMVMKTGTGQMVFLLDSKTKTMTTLMDMMGQKIAMKMNEDEMEKKSDKQKETTIKYVDGTKVICGYLCHKAEATMFGMKEAQIVYYTKEIPAKNVNMMNRGLKGLDGFPLEFILTMKGIGMKMTAKSISMDKIDDSIFKIPEGYKEMTMEEAMKSQTNTNTEVKSDTILTKKTPKAPDFVMPSFPGGDDSLLNYLSKNVKYPDKARKDKIEGKVLVTFMVNADGRLSDFNILISLSEECDAEAMRVVKAMPNWIPAKRNGKIYPIKMNLPVWFKL